MLGDPVDLSVGHHDSHRQLRNLAREREHCGIAVGRGRDAHRHSRQNLRKREAGKHVIGEDGARNVGVSGGIQEKEQPGPGRLETLRTLQRRIVCRGIGSPRARCASTELTEARVLALAVCRPALGREPSNRTSICEAMVPITSVTLCRANTEGSDSAPISTAQFHNNCAVGADRRGPNATASVVLATMVSARQFDARCSSADCEDSPPHRPGGYEDGVDRTLDPWMRRAELLHGHDRVGVSSRNRVTRKRDTAISATAAQPAEPARDATRPHRLPAPQSPTYAASPEGDGRRHTEYAVQGSVATATSPGASRPIWRHAHSRAVLRFAADRTRSTQTVGRPAVVDNITTRPIDSGADARRSPPAPSPPPARPRDAPDPERVAPQRAERTNPLAVDALSPRLIQT